MVVESSPAISREPRSLSLGLLCGGLGRRMGGPKEGLIHQSGLSLLQLQLDRLDPFFAEVLLLTGETAKRWPEGGNSRVLVDPRPFAGQGPMAGLLAGLRESATDWLALMPIDNPLFPPEAFVEALLRVGLPDGSGSPLALGFLDQGGHPRWLPGLYHRDLHPTLEEALGSGQLSLGRWVQSVNHVFLPWTHNKVSSERAFTNINTPEEAATLGFHRGPRRLATRPDLTKYHVSGTSD